MQVFSLDNRFQGRRRSRRPDTNPNNTIQYAYHTDRIPYVTLSKFMTKKAIFHFIIEFLPTFGFFIAAQFATFYVATVVLMVLAFGSFLIGWRYERNLPLLPIFALAFILVSGSITLSYQAPDALIVANSIYFLLFSGVIFGGLIIQKNVLKKIFSATFALTERGWHVLAIRWATLLLLIGLGNEYVRVFYDEAVWVDYKFATTIFMSCFAVAQLAVSRRYRVAHESNVWGIRTTDTPTPRDLGVL